MLKKSQLKTTKSLCGGASEIKFSLTYPRALLKEDKLFMIVYPKSGLQDFRLSEGKHQNNGGSKVAKKW